MEDRKESTSTGTGLPVQLLPVTEEPSGESRAQSTAESSSLASFKSGAPHYNTSASPSISSSNRRPTPSPPPTSRADKSPPTPERMSNQGSPRPVSQNLDSKEESQDKNEAEAINTAESSSNSNSTDTIVEQAESTTKVTEKEDSVLLPKNEVQNNVAKDEAVDFIKATLKAHNLRQSAISALDTTASEEPVRSIKNRIFTARPWQKKKASLPPSLSLMEEDEAGNDMSSSSSNLSEEERDGLQLSAEVLEHARRLSLRAIQGVVKAHDIRSSALERLEADKDLFTNGKVSALKAKFNERRRSRANATAMANEGRSDGVTDDDDDVVY